MRTARSATLLPLLIAVAISAYVFFPLLGVVFHGDDFLHFYELENLGLVGFLAKMHGGHFYVARNIVYLTSHALFGLDPVPYMWIVLLTHLFSVGLLVLLLQRLTRSPWLACFGGVMWGASPLNEGVLAWYCVYGQALATALTLWVLLQLARVADGAACGRAAPWRWAALMLVASASFGVGIGLTLAMPAAAWLLLPASPDRRRIVIALGVGAIALVPIYFGMVELNKAWYPQGPPLAGTDQTWLGALRFLAHLLAAGSASLVLGGFFQPAQYPSPPAYTAAAVVAVAVAVALLRGSAVQRRQILAGLLLAVAAYSLIALGRSSLFSTRVTGALVRSARYHYAGPLGLALVLAVAAAVWAQWGPRSARGKTVLLSVWLALAVAGDAFVAAPLDQAEGARVEAERILATIRAAAAAAPPGAPVYVENHAYFLSQFLFTNFPGWAALFAIYHPDGTVDGHRVYFVVADPAQRAAWRNGRRGAGLVVAPDEVPPPG